MAAVFAVFNHKRREEVTTMGRKKGGKGKPKGGKPKPKGGSKKEK